MVPICLQVFSMNSPFLSLSICIYISYLHCCFTWALTRNNQYLPLLSSEHYVLIINYIQTVKVLKCLQIYLRVCMYIIHVCSIAQGRARPGARMCWDVRGQQEYSFRFLIMNCMPTASPTNALYIKYNPQFGFLFGGR